MPMKIIENPVARRGAAQRYFNTVENYFQKHGFEIDHQLTDYAGHAEKIAHQAVQQGFDTIVSVGGDGTLNEIVNGIIKADGDPLLGIIPVGTCNDFIKSVNIPHDIHAACHIVASGYSRRVDVASAGHRYFINAIGIGFDVKIVEDLSIYSVVPGKIGYLSTALKHIFSYKAMPLDLLNGHHDFTSKAIMLTVANGQYYGGTFHIAPQADPTDGLLDVILIEDVPTLRRLSMVPRVIAGTHLTAPNVKHILASELKITASSALTTQIEGELVNWTTNEINLSVLHNRLKIASLKN